MADLSKEERAWIKKLQRVLDECPSDRLGFYTIGDPDLTIYDRSLEEELEAMQDSTSTDWCCCVEKLDAGFCLVKFPAAVHSTCG